MNKKRFLLGAITATLIGSSCYAISMEAAPEMGLFKKKKKKTEQPTSDYKKIVGSDSVNVRGVMNVVKKEQDFYLEMPTKLMGRVFLVSNKLQRVPSELNEAGVNRGINYENQCIRFEWNQDKKTVFVRQQRLTPEVDSKDAMAASVESNYIDPLIASLKVEAVAKDSSTVIFKVNDLFNGKKTYFNDVFNLINLGTSADSDLSRIIDIKAFSNNITATSELTTVVHEGKSKTNITVEVSSSLVLLPETPMVARKENQRVGYFTTSRLQYGDHQQEVTRNNYITRWRLEPKDEQAYLRGELVEPKKPIVFYIDPAVPEFLRPYIKRGMTDWNAAFEKAGFKNAVQVFDLTDSIAAEGDDMKYSVLTYDASEKANAMGPSVIDPRTGEILEADIIWWHNVKSLLREWIMVQTGAYNKEARQYELPEALIGDAARFVACHEVGHSLGLRHNMIASNAYPTDSLRSKSFTDHVCGTAASIMDYARFNYVAQPGDKGVKLVPPALGVYDEYAIKWLYTPVPEAKDIWEEAAIAGKIIDDKAGDPLYRYGAQQVTNSASYGTYDPSARTEDLGDDPIKSSDYGIKNLKYILPRMNEWLGADDKDFTHRGALYTQLTNQYYRYIGNVLAQVGGIYLNNVKDGSAVKPSVPVARKVQKASLKWVVSQLCSSSWINEPSVTSNLPLATPESNKICAVVAKSLVSTVPNNVMLSAAVPGVSRPYTIKDYYDDLYTEVFASSIAGRKLASEERTLQREVLMASSKDVKSVLSRSFAEETDKYLDGSDWCSYDACNLGEGQPPFQKAVSVLTIDESDGCRILFLNKVKALCLSQRHSASSEDKAHYEFLLARVNSALQNQK